MFKINLKSLSEKAISIYIITIPILNYSVELNNISRMLFLISLVFTLMLAFSGKKIKYNSLLFLLVSFIIVSFVSYLFNSNTIQDTSSYSTLLQSFILFFIVFYNFSNKEGFYKFMKILFYMGITLTIYSVVISGPDFFQYIREQERFGDEVNQINVFGYYLSLSIIASLFLYIKNKKIIYLISIPYYLFFGLMTGSRKFLFLIFLISFFYIIRYYKDNKKTIAITLITTLIFFLLLGKVDLLPSTERFTLISGFLKSSGTEDKSLLSRIGFIKFGYSQFKIRPIFGHGLNQFRYLFQNSFGSLAASHNNYIDLLVDNGIVGFVLYYLFFILILKENFKSKQEHKTTLILLVLIILINDLSVGGSINFKYNWILMGILYSNSIILSSRNNIVENKIDMEIRI